MRLHRVIGSLAALTAAASGFVVPAHAAAVPPLPAGRPVVTISAEGGFVAPGYIKSALPALVAYANGVVLLRNDAAPRPDVRAMRLHVLTSSRVRRLATAVAKAAVVPAGGWGTPGVADVPNTRVQIAYPGLVRDVSVFALGFTGNGNVTAAQARARRALQTSIDALTSAVRHTLGRAWRPSTYEAWTMSELVRFSGVGMPNPASVFCESMGGTVAIVDEPAGQRGDCVLPDGTRTDEWKYFRTTAPTLAQWPTDVAAPTAACTVVSYSAFATSWRGSNETARWVLPSGQAPMFVFRPVLPGEDACARG